MKRQSIIGISRLFLAAMLLFSATAAFTQSPNPEPAGKSRGRGPKPREARTQGYSIEQAVSDKAQLNTIAFSGLAFMTGTLGADTFLPPGKVADFFGFQYMRDNTRQSPVRLAGVCP